jgi:hypothetical protein
MYKGERRRCCLPSTQETACPQAMKILIREGLK